MTAPTRDERREVAERIRALPSDIYSTIKGWEKDGLFVNATICDEADYSLIHNAVFGCFPAEYVHPGDREELHERLADLIDPTRYRVIPDEEEGYVFCSNCGAEIGEYGVPNYCHNCGHRVV